MLTSGAFQYCREGGKGNMTVTDKTKKPIKKINKPTNQYSAHESVFPKKCTQSRFRSHHTSNHTPSYHVTPLPPTSQEGTTDRPAHTRPPRPLDRHSTATRSRSHITPTPPRGAQKSDSSPRLISSHTKPATSHPSAPSRCVGTADGNIT